MIHDKIISSDNGSSLYLHNITTAHAGRYTINSRSFKPKCFEFIFYSYTCTADNGVGNPVTEEVLLTVLCKYINKLQSRSIGPIQTDKLISLQLSFSLQLECNFTPEMYYRSDLQVQNFQMSFNFVYNFTLPVVKKAVNIFITYLFSRNVT